MEYFKKFENKYYIEFFYYKTLIIIKINNLELKGKSIFKFTDIELTLDDISKYNISKFSDLKAKIEKNIIQIDIKEYFSDNKNGSNLKFLGFILKKHDEHDENIIIIERKIYELNVEYFLTNGLDNKRINSNPFITYYIKDSFNLTEILDLVNREKILSGYEIDEFRYYDYESKVFKKITHENKNIGKNEKLIFEFHIKKAKNYFLIQLKWIENYLNKEIQNLNRIINKYSDICLKYDLIYLYSSPIILDDNYKEFESPISYMEEIRIILELMKNKRKKYNCKFECAGYNVLRDILQNHKTKILHISAHGYFSNPVYFSKNKGKEIYNLCLENLKKNGQIESININQLKSILYLNRANISQLDLVIVSTCYSEDFANLFLEYGAKNIIYINGKTEIIDRISVIFVKYFYQNLIEGQTIKNSYENAIKSMKLDKEVTSLNKNSCCCNHYHKPSCPLREDYYKKNVHSQLHIQKLKKCKCKYEKPNYHDEECEYYKTLKKQVKSINIQDNINKICCCDEGIIIEHNELSSSFIFFISFASSFIIIYI